MPSGRDQKTAVGLPEVAGGTVAGLTVAHFAGKSLAAKPIERIASQLPNVVTQTMAAFMTAHPMPPSVASGLSEPAAEAWLERSHAAIRTAVAPLQKEAAALENPLKRPLIAFANASAPAKIAMGAAIASSAVGMGWIINQWRTSNADSHAERIERERRPTDPGMKR